MEEGIARGAKDYQVDAEPYRDIDFSQAKRGPVAKTLLGAGIAAGSPARE